MIPTGSQQRKMDYQDTNAIDDDKDQIFVTQKPFRNSVVISTTRKSKLDANFKEEQSSNEVLNLLKSIIKLGWFVF